MVAIEVRDAVKEYESGGGRLRALDGVDFRGNPGEFIAVMGPSGSGKSTLLNVLGLLDVPTAGRVHLDGEDVTDLEEPRRTLLRKREIGFVFQDFYLLPTLTARENVELPRVLDRPSELSARAQSLLDRVGLGEYTAHTPDELSGGQKQRVAIARSLVNDPSILLADEPTGNLDRETGETVLGEFERICAEGVTAIAVTHDEQVSRHADRRVDLVDGEIR